MRVRCRKIRSDSWGYCTLLGRGDNRHYRICLQHDAGDVMQRETLLHEWAHALCWSHRDDQRETEHGWHGPEWGVAYALVYATVFEEATSAEQECK